MNKIREIPQQPSIVATHSDAKEVFLWHFDRQPNRSEHVRASFFATSTIKKTLLQNLERVLFSATKQLPASN